MLTLALMRNRIFALFLMVAFTLSLAAQGTRSWGQFRLQNGDTLSVVVKDERALDTRKAVIMDGKIELAKLGKVPADGLTIREFSQIVTGRYRELVKDPKVTINIHFF